MAKKNKKTNAPVHKDLQGLNIYINEFGQIISNTPIETINEFLNKNQGDKKNTSPKENNEETETHDDE